MRVPMWQTTLATCLGVPSSEKAERNLRRLKISTFKFNPPVELRGYRFIGQKNGFCYYRDEGFYVYHAYDPLTGRRVGELNLDSLDRDSQKGEHALSYISVEPDYQEMGIGSHLVNLANITNSSENAGTRLVVFGGQAEKSRYRLTDLGMKLILSCLRKGILEDDQFLGNVSCASPHRR